MKYEEYKDSGVEWIGEVPSHWEVCRLKNYSKIVLGKMLMSTPPKGEEAKYTSEKYLKSRNVGWMDIYDNYDDLEDMWFNEYEKSIYQLQLNDIVMNEGGDIGKLGIWKNSEFPCYIQNSINKITANRNIIPFYLQYLLFAIAKTNYFWSIVNPISIAHLTKEKLSNTPILVPPLSEQQAIATYLDEKCEKLNTAIEVQKKKIELLEELKQSIITNAVTKGLNPYAPMKDSGVEWIGEVPRHWEVMKTSLAFNHIGSGTTPSTSKGEYYVDEGEYWLQTGDLIDGLIEDTSKKISKTAIKECNLKFYPEDSVVIAMYGATIGKMGLLKVQCATNQACCVLPRNKFMDARYTFYFFLSAKSDLLISAIGGGQPNISQDVIKKTKIIKPPLSEQQAIAAHLDKECDKIAAQISKANRRIELLEELKQSIITEAVTGKIKVC